MKKVDDSFIRGVIVGHIFTSEVFREHFEKDFAKALDNAPSLAGILQRQITEKFLGDDPERVDRIYNWVLINYGAIFSHVDKAFIRSIIWHVLENSGKTDFSKINPN